jgi:hypothetical protein
MMHKKYCESFEEHLQKEGIMSTGCACDVYAHMCDEEARVIFTLGYPIKIELS